MSFVDILPLEVVHEIFILCGVDMSDFTVDWSTTTSLKRRLPTYPVFLTRVNKSWANAALSCRPLWSTISARVGEEGRKCWPPPRVVESWIARSGNLPLSISVMPHVWQQDGMYYANSPTARRDLEDLLISHHTRWRRVALWYSPTTFYPVDLAKRTPRYAALDSISLWGTLDNDCILHILANAPRLRALELEPRGPRHRYQVPALLGESLEDAIPWDRLKEVRLGVLGGKLDNAEGVLQLLQICPNLEIMATSMVRDRNPDLGLNIPPVQHHRLRGLDFGQSSEDQYMFFLDHVTLPGLTKLALTPHGEHESDFTDRSATLSNVFASFVTRSACEIEEFTYCRTRAAPLRKDPPLQSPSAVDLLTTISSSVVRVFLEVSEAAIGHLINYLTFASPMWSAMNGSSSYSCPRLRHLTLLLWPATKAPQAVDYYVYPAQIFRLIQSRWTTPYPSGVRGLETIAVQIMVKEERRAAGNVAHSANHVANQRLIDGMKEHSGRLKAMRRAMPGRRLNLSVVAPPRQLYSQNFSRR